MSTEEKKQEPAEEAKKKDVELLVVVDEFMFFQPGPEREPFFISDF